jgi:putative ATPase
MPVPPHLRDGHSMAGRNNGDAPGYQYPHDDPRGWTPQQYIPDGVQTQPYYEPTSHGREAAIKTRLESLKSSDNLVQNDNTTEQANKE